jgi:hypothetical protein
LVARYIVIRLTKKIIEIAEEREVGKKRKNRIFFLKKKDNLVRVEERRKGPQK